MPPMPATFLSLTCPAIIMSRAAPAEILYETYKNALNSQLDEADVCSLAIASAVVRDISMVKME